MQTYLLDSALKILIYASIEHRKNFFRQFSETKMDRGILNNYCTVRMSTARGGGHTHAVAEAARMFAKPIVMSPSEGIGRRLLELVKDDDKIMFFSAEAMARGSARGYDCDAILVDCAFGLSSRQIEHVEYHALACLPKHGDTFCLVYVE